MTIVGDSGEQHERVTLLTNDEVEKFSGSADPLQDENEKDCLPIFSRRQDDNGGPRRPVSVIVVGMAGSGKTTFMTALNDHLDMVDERKRVELNENGGDGQKIPATVPPAAATDGKDDDEGGGGDENDDASDEGPSTGYYVNLDPAATHMPFDANIDIRDTVKYRNVMSEYGLGPNGAIMTCLNLFATKFDQVLSILERHADENSSNPLDYVLIDTPGQIEAFTWSASGTIIGESLATSFPTVLAYVVDTPRCTSPATFMSNMLYASSMLYRTRLPLIVVFNKTDVVSADVVQEWMTDYEKFQLALDAQPESAGYYSSLVRSMSLVLDEFYANIHHVAVSSLTGEGIESFFNKVDAAAVEFENEYLPDLKNRVEEQAAKKRAIARSDLRRLHHDVENDATK